MVITFHRCSYDNSTISSVNKVKQYDVSLLFPSFTFLSFTFLFNLFFKFMCRICQRVALLNLMDTKVNPNCLLFHRERERENRPAKSRGDGVVRWCLESIQSRSVLLIWIIVRVYCTCSRCGWGLFAHFFSRLSFLFCFLSLWETARYRLKYCLKGPLNTKQLTNQIQS